MADKTIIGKAKRIFESFLIRQGSRKTPERFSVIDELYALPQDEHIDVEGLFLMMRNKGYTISRATIYNTLDLLVECDLVSKHQFGKNLAQYEKSYGYKQHDHLICTECHKVKEFCDPRIQNIQNTVGEILDFNIIHHSLILYGNCTNDACENKTEDSATTARQTQDL